MHKPWVQCPLNVPHNPHPVLPKLLLQKANLAQSHPMLPSDSPAHLERVVQTVGGASIKEKRLVRLMQETDSPLEPV